jgi:hypothetical protein
VDDLTTIIKLAKSLIKKKKSGSRNENFNRSIGR